NLKNKRSPANGQLTPIWPTMARKCVDLPHIPSPPQANRPAPIYRAARTRHALGQGQCASYDLLVWGLTNEKSGVVFWTVTIDAAKTGEHHSLALHAARHRLDC